MKINRLTSGRVGEGKGYSKLLDPANIILTIAAIAALFFLVSFSRANMSLMRTNEQLRENAARAMQAEVGDAVPPFESIDLEGKPASVSYNGAGKHLLFIFTTHCDACVAQFPVWDQLAAQATAKSFVVRGISVDSIEDTKLNFADRYPHLNTIVAPSKNLLRTYRVTSFPQVMIVSTQGVVEWLHVGKLSDEQIQELLSKLTSSDALPLSKANAASASPR